MRKLIFAALFVASVLIMVTKECEAKFPIWPNSNSRDIWLKIPNVEILIAEVISFNPSGEIQVNVEKVLRGDKSPGNLTVHFYWNDQLAKGSYPPDPVPGDKVIFFGRQREGAFQSEMAYQGTIDNERIIVRNMSPWRSGKRNDIGQILCGLLAIVMLGGAIGFAVVGWKLIYQRIKVSGGGAVVGGLVIAAILGFVISIPIAKIVLETPALALGPAILFAVIGSSKLSSNKRSALLQVLAAIVWGAYWLYESEMNAWSFTVTAPIRVDLFLIAPVVSIVGTCSIWLGLVNKNVGRKNGA